MTRKLKSIKDVCEFFWKLEQKYDLLDFTYGLAKPWQYRRIDLYYRLAKKSGVLEQAHSELSTQGRIQKLWKFIINSFLYNPYITSKADVAVFSHPRAKSVDGKNIDIYTHYFIESLRRENIRYVEYRKPYLGEHQHSKSKNVKYLDFILILTYFFKLFVSAKENIPFVKSLQDDIDEVVEDSFDIDGYLKNESKRFKVEFYLYTFLFKVNKCKKIYVVPSYGNGAVVDAAKKMKIEVVEIQHGTFSRYHLGYSYPNRIELLDYFPDKFMVWNRFWKEMMPLPIQDENVIVYQFDYLKNLRNNYCRVGKVKNRAIVISQGAIGEQIANKILQNYDRFKEYDIFYKLHPGEYDRWETYPSLVKLLEYENITLVKKIDLYEEFAKSEYQIGVFSTAIYEGVEFECKTILLNVNGIEYMDRFMELNSNVEIVY